MKIVSMPNSALTLLLSFLLLISCSEDHQKPTKTYLLVHGASHGAWAWKKVVPLLQAEGHRVVSIDLPGHGEDKTPSESVMLEDYVNKIIKVANSQEGPVILVGHSAAGVSIAQAAERLQTGKVEKLIFLDAFLPKSGESVFSLAAKFLPPSTTGEPNFSDSFVFDQTGATFTLDTARVADFLYHDCSAADISFAKANLGKQPVAPFATPVKLTDEKFGRIRKYYIICSLARNGDMTAMAKNVPMDKVVTLTTSHSPFFSQPKTLTDIIISF